MTELPQTDDWCVFHGEASPAEARVFVRLLLAPTCAADRLRGEIVGPFSRYAKTLPATTNFSAARQGDDLLAAVTLPDPCFWSPELPYLYRVRVRLEHSAHEIWSEERTFGVRRLGVRGRRIYFEAKNWVLRGAMTHESPDFPWDDWRAFDLAPVVCGPSEAFCREADRQGVLLAAILPQAAPRPAELVKRWQRHPAVGLVVTEPLVEFSPDFRAAAPNMIFAAQGDVDRSTVPGWADATWRQLRNPADVSKWTTGIQRPLVVVRRSTGVALPAQLRAACDRLQSDLADAGEFAGYVV